MAAILQFRLTTNNLGGAATATQLSATALNNLWDDVTPAEATAGDNEYRAIDVYNAGDATTSAVSLYLSGTPNAATDILAALEASPIGSTTAIADESTAPTVSGSFVAYTSASRLTLPDISAGSYCRVWLKRSVTAGAVNSTNDGTTLTVEYA